MIWLDKTGTLTHGRLVVSSWNGDGRWLAIAAAIEKSFSTPIAFAIVDYVSGLAEEMRELELPEATRVSYVNGKGVAGYVASDRVILGNQAFLVDHAIPISADWLCLQFEQFQRGRSVVWLAVNGAVVGMFGTSDSLRKDAAETLKSLTDRRWRVGILSGDRQEIVDRVASELKNAGVELVAALGNQTPERKLEIVRCSQQEQVGPCVMVGDGVNDAAALALADVGIAIRSGGDQALSTAPIYLANPRLTSVIELIDASKNVVWGIRKCFFASLVYNCIAIGLAMAGWIHPLVAAILMPMSGLTVLAMAITTCSFQPKNHKT